MLGLFKKTKPFTSILEGYVECHSHILPGVDDGVKTVEDSLAILKRYEAAGVKGVWFTPHIMEDMPNTPEHLIEVFNDLKSRYEGGMSLFLASENMMDELFEKRLFEGKLLPIGGRSLLVETSYFNPPYNLYEIIDRIFSAGYFPILAHPERYVYMSDKDYDTLKKKGVLFQMNLTSIVGLYGKVARRKASRLLKKGYYNYVGTDIHRESLLDKLNEAEISVKELALLENSFASNREMWLTAQSF